MFQNKIFLKSVFLLWNLLLDDYGEFLSKTLDNKQSINQAIHQSINCQWYSLILNMGMAMENSF